MTDSEWTNCESPQQMIDHLAAKFGPDGRRFRVFIKARLESRSFLFEGGPAPFTEASGPYVEFPNWRQLADDFVDEPDYDGTLRRFQLNVESHPRALVFQRYGRVVGSIPEEF